MIWLTICAATMQESTVYPGETRSWIAHAVEPYPMMKVQTNTAEENLGVVGSYQRLYETESSGADVLLYLHDDVVCRETGWNARLAKEFEDERVGVVGFGGALGHGASEIYKVPYELHQLRRIGYRSNTDDAEAHGERFESACDVAVLDGFAIAVRRSLLDKCGGWPVGTLQFHNYDYAICCLAHRLGYRVRLVGVRCHHLGGRTSTTKAYQEWAVKQGASDGEVHEKAHRWIYEEFRDVLPFRVKETK